MPVKRPKIRWGYESWKRWVFNRRWKVCNDDDETTASGRPFQTWAAATGKAQLPTVDSLMGSATRQLVLADSRARRPGRSATATRSPDIAARCHETLWKFLLHAFWDMQPVQCRQRIRDVIVQSQMVDESCRRVEHRLQTVYQVGWNADQYCIAVVEPWAYQSHYEHLERGCRHRSADLAELTERSEALRHRSFDVRPQRQVCVNVNAEITDLVKERMLWNSVAVGKCVYYRFV